MVLRYGLIGCGRIAKRHYIAAMRNNLTIVAICDISYDTLTKFSKFNSLPESVKKYISYKDMISNEELDIVAIATPSGSHYMIAEYCIKQHINIIVEKPITLCLAEADKLIRLCNDKKVIATVCHQNRFNLSVQKTYAAIVEKKISNISHICAHVRWNRSQEYYNNASWRGTWLNDGGALMNQGIHNADILRWFCGSKIEEVFAYISNRQHPNIEVEDVALSVVKFSNGSYGMIEVTTNVYPQNLEETLYVFSENGTIKLGGQSLNKIENWDLQLETDNIDTILSTNSEFPQTIYGNGHIALYKDFINAIINKKQPYIILKDGRDSLELVLAIYKSALLHQPVHLPMDAEFSLQSMKALGLR